MTRASHSTVPYTKIHSQQTVLRQYVNSQKFLKWIVHYIEKTRKMNELTCSISIIAYILTIELKELYFTSPIL